MTEPFNKGMALCAAFYEQVVREIVEEAMPGLPYAAGLIDYGSEVLGYDTPMSTDHDWGPRVTLFVRERDYVAAAPRLQDRLAQALPATFGGYNIKYWVHSGPEPTHRVVVQTPEAFFQDYLGCDVHSELDWIDWLVFTEQKLRTVQHGRLFHDTIGLQAIRDRLAFYPDDVWYYLMACDWIKLSQEQPFVGRAGDVGDELGSGVIATRLIHTLMHLVFLMERQYAPYSKWFGTAFGELAYAPDLSPLLEAALASDNWHDRERHLVEAGVFLTQKHNALGITEPMPEKPGTFFTRGYSIIRAEASASALRERITSPELRRLPFVGSVNQITASVDVLKQKEPFRAYYQQLAEIASNPS